MILNSIADKISKHRTFLMGIAILWIVIFHTMIDFHNIVLNFIRDIGDCGVDIFLFLSGFGIYYSLKKNDTYSFYKKRLKRIFIPYIPLLLIWCSAIAFFSNISIYEILGNLYMIGIWVGLQHQYAWFVQLVVLLYLISPIIYYLFRRTSNSHKLLFYLILFFWGLSFIFFDTSIYHKSIRGLAFFIGMYFAHSNFKNEKKERFFWNILFFIGIILLIISKLWVAKVLGLSYHWIIRNSTYPFFVPGVCLLLSPPPPLIYKLYIMYPFPFQFLYRIISFMGTISLELYLIHVAIFRLAYKFLTNADFILWGILVILCIILSILYNRIIKYIMEKFITKSIFKEIIVK